MVHRKRKPEKGVILEKEVTKGGKRKVVGATPIVDDASQDLLTTETHQKSNSVTCTVDEVILNEQIIFQGKHPTYTL